MRFKRFILLVACLTLPISSPAQSIPKSASLPKTLPWDLSALGNAPAFEWVGEPSTVRSLTYASEPYRGKPTKVFAYFASPATLEKRAPASGEKFPAMVLIHGGGGTAFREWAELWAKQGYAAIAMDTAGYQPVEGQNAHDKKNRTRLAEGGPDQSDEEKFGSIDLAPSEQWPYHAVAAAVKAHSLIRSFPEVDAEKTGVTGISWGGYLTSIVAGIDSRFKVAIPVYGCGFLQENSAWVARLQKMTPEQRQRWVSLWDPSQYLPAANMPMLFVNGTNDFAYPLDSYMKSYALPKGPKDLRITVKMPHGHPPGWAPTEIALYANQHLRGGAPLPRLSTPKLEGSTVSLQTTNHVEIKGASLHSTIEDGAINKRNWTSTPLTLSNGVISGPSPDASTTAWFITVTDPRGATVSTPVTIKK
jgi:dienelactone hydrolase